MHYRYWLLSLLLALAAVFIITSSAAAWPSQSQWLPSIDSRWTYVTDPPGDVNPPGAVDCVVDVTSPTPAASYWYFDGTNMYFRMILDDAPLKIDSKTGTAIKLSSNLWNILIDSTGDRWADWSISLDGAGSNDRLTTRYNLGADNTMDALTGWSITASETPTVSGGFTYLVNGSVRVATVSETASQWHNGNPDYYLDMQVPLTWLSRQGSSSPAPVTQSTPLRICFGSSTNGDTVNKDLVGQSDTTDAAAAIEAAPAASPESAMTGSHGVLLDARHASSPVNMGLWHSGEMVTVSGYGWPLPVSPLYTGTLLLRILDPTSSIVWEGTVPNDATGMVSNAPTWQIGQSAANGVYSIYVADPRQPSLYYRKDTFSISEYDLTTSSKAVDKLTALGGEELTYTITLNNTGGAASPSVVLFDSPPGLTTYVPDSTKLNGIAQPDVAGRSVLVDGLVLGSIAPSSTVTVTFKVTIDISTPDQSLIQNKADITWSGGFIEVTATTTVDAPMITVVKSVSLGSAMPGETLTYSVVCTNLGHATATSLALVDAIPAETTYVIGSTTSSGIAQPTFRHTEEGAYDSDELAPIIALKWLIPTLAPGESITLSFNAIVR